MDTSNITIDPAIFKAYDVRGIYGQDLTDEIAYRIGRAAAQYLSVPEIAVGRDMRLSSPQLAASLARIAAGSGQRTPRGQSGGSGTTLWFTDVGRTEL